MISPFGTALDPTFDEILFLVGKRLFYLGWRHHIIVVVGDDAIPRFTGIKITGNKCTNPLIVGEGVFLEVESEAGFAMFFIRAVTEEAFVRKDGPDVAGEVYGAAFGKR